MRLDFFHACGCWLASSLLAGLTRGVSVVYVCVMSCHFRKLLSDS